MAGALCRLAGSDVVFDLVEVPAARGAVEVTGFFGFVHLVVFFLDEWLVFAFTGEEAGGALAGAFFGAGFVEAEAPRAPTKRNDRASA